ncbi:iron-sulfur cluster biosynthesis family protein [Paenibacillus ginsengarvi]|uniref:Iron-sulfur cluster biosynthesis family protein n=1 Tax=Paenibacillus ginsengarvi TaxID=400777 RepID=A0A3B0CQB0_9BACL|nr:iron-sulfur cluster biosynthesis family protein [Paenibacillus ginsengarvi]RKN86601.1 iron-sulfur cluster biosynthesis family protein [Paenibacillus ginsengarvi]
MYIHFTDDAAAFIRQTYYTGTAAGALKLAYDTDGCGCAVNGVAALWLVNNPDEDDQLARSNAFTVFFDPKQAVFFEEELTVDRKPGGPTLVLKSKQQTYNSHMKTIDFRTAAAGSSSVKA